MSEAAEKKEKKGPWRLDCGCDGTGARCDREGILYAQLEAARNRMIAAGLDPSQWWEGKGGVAAGTRAGELFAARRAYHAHYAPHLRRFREGEG